MGKPIFQHCMRQVHYQLSTTLRWHSMTADLGWLLEYPRGFDERLARSRIDLEVESINL